MPSISVKPAIISVDTGSPVALPWPTYGEGAIGAQGYGLLASSGAQTPRPMASIAKVITALAILKKKPLDIGQQGPTITLTQRDVDFFNYYYTIDGSVVKVSNGEQISQYQALQAMMLPSSNNLADSLSAWAFGSVNDYVTYANKMLSEMNIKDTKIADASGFSAASTSTASDLVKIGDAVMNYPVLAQISAQKQATIPVAGQINNVNGLLGIDGNVGIKTGNTDQAGGCFLFAANRSISGKNITVIGALMGAPNLVTAIKDSRPLITSADSGFVSKKLVSGGDFAGKYFSEWGQDSEARILNNAQVIVWKGMKTSTAVRLNNIKARALGSSYVGSVEVTYGNKKVSTPVVLSQTINKPSFAWRLFR